MGDSRPESEDNAKSGVHAGCGAILGLFVPLGGSIVGISIWRSIPMLVVVCLVSAAFFGFVAYQLGDRFWDRIGKWTRWT